VDTVVGVGVGGVGREGGGGRASIDYPPEA